MTVNTLIIGAFVVGAGALAIDYLGGWEIIIPMVKGENKTPKDENRTTKPTKKYTIYLHHPNNGVFRFNGKINKDKGKFTLLDKNGLPIGEYGDANFRVRGIKSLFEDTPIINLDIEDDSRYLRMTNEVRAKDDLIINLRRTIDNLQQSYKIIHVKDAKIKGEAYKAEYGGRKIFMDKTGKIISPSSGQNENMGDG